MLVTLVAHSPWIVYSLSWSKYLTVMSVLYLDTLNSWNDTIKSISSFELSKYILLTEKIWWYKLPSCLKPNNITPTTHCLVEWTTLLFFMPQLQYISMRAVHCNKEWLEVIMLCLSVKKKYNKFNECFKSK